jgi:hypothetical protein
MKKQFTPGEWKQSHREIPNDEDGMYATQVHTEDGETIATLSWYPMPKISELYEGKNVIVSGTYRDGNAQLISSSPNLLKALEDILKWSAHFPEAMNEELIYAKNAIDKAIA